MVAALAIALAVGFAPAPVLNHWESVMAGKPAQVFCWNTPIDAAGHVDAGGYVNVVGGTQTYLAEQNCDSLRRDLAGKYVTPDAFAVAFFVLVHEAYHLRGDADESQTDCDALHHMPGFLVSLLHFKHWQVHNAMAEAWAVHRLAPPIYQTRC